MSENKVVIAGIDEGKDFYQVQNNEFVYENAKKDKTVYQVLKEDLYREIGTQLAIKPDGDYIGMMQYRRFFTQQAEYDKPYIGETYLNDKTARKYGLNTFSISDVMKSAQIIYPEMVVTRAYDARNVREYFAKFDKKHDAEHFVVFENALKEKYPEYSSEFESYMKSGKMVLCNMFLMKRELFVTYNKMVESVLAVLDEKLDMRYASYEQTKEYSMFTAVMLATFCRYQEKQGVTVRELPVVEFEDVTVKTELKPAFEHNNVAMVLASSDFYTIYLSAMLESIVENASDENNYDINVLESGIRPDNKEALKLIAEGHENVSIRFYNVKEKMANIHLKATGHISVETYYRLLIPEIFINYDKVLFLDSDMTVHADVAELFHMDVTGYMVAAAHDQCCAAFLNGSDKSFAKYCRESLKLKNVHDYFQAGVMLLNLTRFREKYTQKEIFEIATKRQYRYVDQDIMNVLCQGEVKHLDLEWDCFPDFGPYEYEFLPYYLQKQYAVARKNPKICHHTGPNKPWSELFADTMQTEHFWRRARKSPLYEQILFRTMMTASGAFWSGEIVGKKKSTKIKNKIKYGFIVPAANGMFPRGTKRRKSAIKFYYGIRRKEIPTWELDD